MDAVQVVVLPNGSRVGLKLGRGNVERDVAASFLKEIDASVLLEPMRGLCEAVLGAVQNSGPSRVSIGLEIELEAQAGGVLLVLGSGAGRGAISLTLEWDREVAAE